MAITRRTLLLGAAGLAASGSWSAPASPGAGHLIAASGEGLQPIGMGTWITFNVGNSPQLIAQRGQVLQTFFALGGQVIDSSPMYGSAEAVLGTLFDRTPPPAGLFAETKIWTASADTGRTQFADSQRLWRRRRLDAVLVHNLLNWREHLAFLRELKQQGSIRYLGVSTSHGRRHGELEHLLLGQALDIVQLTYNLADREAEARLLPLAQDQGVAVIANRPLQGGRLMAQSQGKPLPAWAGELGCANWAQFFLRFIIAHPAISCAIPATSQVAHMRENMGAMNPTPLPDPQQRQRMLRYWQSL